MSKIIEGLKYSETHEWVKVEGDIAIIGVTDFAQKEMGEITYVDCPDVDDEVEKGSEFGALESATHRSHTAPYRLNTPIRSSHATHRVACT